MDHIEKAKTEIRERWFENHKVKSIEGEKGLQRIIWGAEGTNMYQINYVLAGRNVFVSGDLGDAIYSLTCAATLENIKDFNLSYFTKKLSTSEHPKYDFDSKLAKAEIEEYFIDMCDVSDINDLEEEDGELFAGLTSETEEWSTCDQFSTVIYSIYSNTSVDWFDSESASYVSDCGKKLSHALISYWLGLQMVIEQLEAKNIA
ncbi:hypothetical protein [Exiguobacterium sp. NG55]|uniref:hypothetical protein n=1 Tax=Exiguobacterium sp. NG55 TaxID=375477 RepID=UPI0004DED13F|nr:hypothetical protein [Exiguobacterium sp. NG55]